ncbi:hypothetical protein LAC79_38010 (plasmid) [Ensifer adhaerens]|uniref:hypothetical protein n=1 Tax=Ensifer adhaerens TaxID=106592 RepID=UPI001CCB14B1|nr:hypothetical protein [Ensifer adhaerens]MBZ7927533.1 hypothetical protein [Ensifer adhaerens]
MNKKSSELENLARAFYRDHKKVLGLIKEDNAGSGFEPAVHRLFGNNPAREKLVRIGNSEFMFSGLTRSQVSFLPARWRQEFDKTRSTWRGCENWWAGYPLISLVELRAGDLDAKGYLRLNAEVGPVSNHRVRAGIIEAISTAASAKGLKRIQFLPGASDKGRLYSRFLRRNSIALSDISDPGEIERKFVELINGFDAEFELVAGAIAQFRHLDDTL